MFYNDNRNNLLYVIILLICIVTSVQIMLNKNVIKDPIARTSIGDSFDISNNIIKADSSKQTVKLLIDASEKSDLDIYINGEITLENAVGMVEISSDFGDVCTLNNVYEEDILVYVNSSNASLADEQGNLFSVVTVKACSEAVYYLRTEK